MAVRSLPPNVIANILSRVPAKSVGRFRCVSKSWLSLISQPEFIKAHLNQIKRTLTSMNESLLIAQSKALYHASLSNAISRRQVFDEMTVVATKLNLVAQNHSLAEGCATCDGLILIEDDDHKWVLLNPITNEIRVLPDPPINPVCLRIHEYKYGLGYDHIADDYKVVIFSTNFYLRVHVCSVQNGTWKEYGSSSRVHGNICCKAGVFHHGRIHWISICFYQHTPLIMAFDLVEERFYNVPVPSLPSGVYYMQDRLGVLEGCLCYMCCVGESREVEVWVMKEYGVQESWTKIKIMMVEPRDPSHPYFRFLAMCMLGQQELVIEKVLEWTDIKLEMFNLDGGTRKNIVVHGVPDEDSGVFVRGTFMETLVSP